MPENIFWTTLFHHEPPNLQRDTSTPKIKVGMAHFELDIPQKGRKEHSTDKLHPHSSDKNLGYLILTSNFGTDSEFH